MIMTRMKLNFSSQQVRRDVADPYEMHRTLQRLLDGKEDRPLWRMEQDPAGSHATLLLQTRERPDQAALTELDPEYCLAFESRHNQLLENIRSGDRLHFRVRANPTVTREGKRHGLVKYEDQLAWIGRTLDRHGAQLVTAAAGAAGRITSGRRRAGRPITTTSVLYDGILNVMQEDAFREMVTRGIGHAKSLGFGLVTLAR